MCVCVCVCVRVCVCVYIYMYICIHAGLTKHGPLEKGNGKPLKYSCLEKPMNSMKRQKGMTLKDELRRWVGAPYATGEEQRNTSRKNEENEPK